jgi:hypothetical protein
MEIPIKITMAILQGKMTYAHQASTIKTATKMEIGGINVENLLNINLCDKCEYKDQSILKSPCNKCCDETSDYQCYYKPKQTA